MADGLPENIPRFTILSELGRGTTGGVYLARFQIPDRPDQLVAMQFPHQGTAADRTARNAQFSSNCRTARSLRHPGIVPLYATGANKGVPFCVRPYVDGDTLRSIALAKTIDLPRGLQILAEVADAVQYVHDHGYVHRNLCGSNILVGKDGHVWLIGFGQVGFLPGSPHLAAGAKGTPAEVDVHALQEMLRGLGSALGQPLPPELARLCEPGAVESPGALVQALRSWM